MKKHLSFLFICLFACSLFAQNIPVDFEAMGNGADWNWTTFENDTNPPLEIIPNPDISGLNTSSTVAKFTALQAGQPFAGCESLHGAGIGTFTITATSSTIRILVWKSVISDVGIKLVRADNWSLGEIKIPNTVVNQWEQIEFDFSAHIGNVYDQIVIFPDFNARTSDNIIYFDAIYGEVATASATTDFSPVDLKLFPNPVANNLKLQSDELIDSYIIYSATGVLLLEENSLVQNNVIDIAEFSKGVYFLKAIIDGKAVVKRFVKE